jgi:hypothetical protein
VTAMEANITEALQEAELLAFRWTKIRTFADVSRPMLGVCIGDGVQGVTPCWSSEPPPPVAHAAAPATHRPLHNTSISPN